MRKLNKEELAPFKRELSEIEKVGIERIIDNMGDSEMLSTYQHEDFGLVYENHGDYAKLTVTEEGFSVEEFEEIQHFSITEDNRLIMVVTDNDYDYVFYEIEPKDFHYRVC